MKLFSKTLIAGMAFAASLTVAPLSQAATPDNQLVIATSLAQVLSVDPQQGTEPKTQEVLAAVYDRLVYSDDADKNTIKPQLAEKWDIDDTGITFHLRDATFSSGNPVTAKDVAFSLTRLLKLNQSASAYYKSAGYTAENIDSLIKVIDEKTFRINLTDKVTAEDMLYRLAMGISSIVDSVEVEKHVDHNDYGNAWLRTHVAGSGPFTLRRWVPNETVILEANNAFWGDKPAMKRVIMRHVPESQTARLMLARGDVDIANALTAPDVKSFTGKSGFKVEQVKIGGFYVLAMNAGRKPLDNPLVREALAYSIDYKGIANTILGPYGRQRNVPVPEDWAGAIANPDWSFQPEKAKKLLAEAGYPDGLTLTLKTIAQPPRVDIATALQANFAQVGIHIEIKQGNGADIVSAHRARDFDLLLPQATAIMPNALGAMNDFVTNPDNRLEAKNAGNFVWRSAWDIPELNTLRNQASSERDPAKRAALIKTLQEKFVAAKPAVLPMFESFAPIVLQDDVKGYTTNLWSLNRLEHVTKAK
ncbi:ABC transporter substrate-binding protein [Superficieibacter electus]|uniref:ABC transporter substrate-binding protein n=1 Tax=Superficieibacter electus TaxID=2022662 RepID=A0ABX4ZDM2_9ENTR|nr:ABC transporter substrate-binding protein [Superficieibacter electus]POP44670.1 ABC transporter substrate-binding protein [Superficieibacter electus]